MFKKILSLTVIVCFFLTTLGPFPKAHADSLLDLPQPGTMVNLSPAYEPVLIKGLKVHPENPFLFDFIIDTGNSNLKAQDSQLKEESNKLIKYFLASLTIPEKDLWVNLSPYEKDRLVDPNLGQTVMGRDMLAQDYILKQLTASLIYPEKHLGKAFWDEVYAKAQQLYGTTQVPVNTFNKVWIVADKADVFEKGNVAYVVGAHLKVMLEEDYMALQKHSVVSPLAPRNDPHSIGADIIRQIILPQIEKEVNTGKSFSALRQMFYSMILASWYKMALKNAILTQIYGNQKKVKISINQADPKVNEQIFNRYLQAYKKGVFNYIKEDINQATKESLPRKYFSGGLAVRTDLAMRVIKTFDLALLGQSGHNFFIERTALNPERVDAAMTASMPLGSPLPWETPLFKQIYEETGVEFVTQTPSMIDFISKIKAHIMSRKILQKRNQFDELGKFKIEPTLIDGPSGTGKADILKLMTKWLWMHQHSDRMAEAKGKEPVIINVNFPERMPLEEIERRVETGLAKAFTNDSILVLDGLESANKTVQGYLVNSLLEDRLIEKEAPYGNPSKQYEINPSYVPIVATYNTPSEIRGDLMARFTTRFTLPRFPDRPGDVPLLYEYFNYQESLSRGMDYKPLSLQAGFLLEFWQQAFHDKSVRGVKNLVQEVLINRRTPDNQSINTTSVELRRAGLKANVWEGPGNRKLKIHDVNGKLVNEDDDYWTFVHGGLPFFNQLAGLNSFRKSFLDHRVPQEKAEEVIERFNQWLSVTKNIKTKLYVKVGKAVINGGPIKEFKALRLQLENNPEDFEYTVKIMLITEDNEEYPIGQIKTTFIDGNRSLWEALQQWFIGHHMPDRENEEYARNFLKEHPNDKVAFLQTFHVDYRDYYHWEGVVHEFDAAMTTPRGVLLKVGELGAADRAMFSNDVGGIDLTRSNMKFKVHKEGQGVQMQFDSAMIARIRRDGFDGIDFQIESIIPVTNLPLLLGLQ